MNKDIIKGNWKELKGKVKQQWGNFTDDDLTQMKGSYEELEGRLQKKYGYDKERVKKEIQTFLDKNNIH
ncbi:MAG: CsbD family protein [Gammaproteobacteria bacterium]|nr:CsbD family protein [Gammaproteobacteria bacterium]